MNNKLVSINITTYNRANQLAKCLDSVLRQSYDEIEINVVDDCSIDNTEEIVGQYKKKYPQVNYFKQKVNEGNAFARNRALAECTGYYVAFMDDDDEWLDQNKLKKQVTVFEQDDNNHLGIVCSSVRIYIDKNNYEDKIFQIQGDIKDKILRGNGLIYNSSVLTKRSIMAELEGFDENLPKGIDSDFYRRCIISLKYRVEFLPDITTIVNEYGDDRMTPLKNQKALINECKSNLMCLNKFKAEFKKDRSALWLRKRRILKNYLRLMKLSFNPLYIFKIIRLLVL